MRPGSPERIQYYRQRAELGEPLFDDAPDGIPMLAGQRNCQFFKHDPEPEPEEPKEMNIDQAIEVLTSDGAEEKLEHRIGQLEAELEKLKKLRRLYQVQDNRVCNIKFDEAIESKIIKAVERGPKTPKEISEIVGLAYGTVGKIVNASKKLRKIGNAVAVMK